MERQQQRDMQQQQHRRKRNNILYVNPQKHLHHMKIWWRALHPIELWLYDLLQKNAKVKINSIIITTIIMHHQIRGYSVGLLFVCLFFFVSRRRNERQIKSLALLFIVIRKLICHFHCEMRRKCRFAGG